MNDKRDPSHDTGHDRSHHTAHVLAQQRQRLEHLATVGELGAGMAHEARNILTGILGFAQVGFSRTNDPEAHKMLSVIEHEARRCIALFTNYLGYADARQEVAKALNLRTCLDQVTELVAHQLRAQRCSLVCVVDAGTPSVIARNGELQQVLVNLIVNAAQASQSGDTVRVNAELLADGCVEITVEDNGPGVPAELHERIFEPFFTTKESGVGTGLGLPISRRIIESHGGTLSVRAASDGGAVFAIRIPVDCSTVDGGGA